MLNLNVYVEERSLNDDGVAVAAEFVIEPLAAGYGHTLGNSLRRVLLSSLEGAAVDSVRIEGIDHEFSTLEGVKEDAVEIILNLKQLRFALQADEATLIIDKKGPGPVTAADFVQNSECQPTNPAHYLASLDKSGSLSMQVTVKRGRGYETIEMKKDRVKSVGLIHVDSTYSPIVAASYSVEKTRVGQETNLDRVILKIVTDGSLTPKEALQQACQILVGQFSQIGQLPSPAEKVEPVEVEEATVELKQISPKTRVEDAGLSSRTTNALLAAGFKTISGLLRLSEIKLEGIKGLGSKGLDEVKAALVRAQEEDNA